jgi:N-acetyl-anhydromuramyl-L-alanine amidase AmpD
VSCAFEVKVGDQVIKGTTSPQGVVDTEVPRAKQAELTVHGATGTQKFTLAMGVLAPASGVLGAQERLQSIGYACQPSGKLDDDTKAAISAFQSDHHLPANGALDAATAKSIDDAYRASH